MKINMVKMLLKKALDIEKTEYLNFQFIFQNKKSKLTNSRGEILNDAAHNIMKDMFIKKLCKEYPKGKFIDVKIYHNKIEGAILRIDGSKEELNKNF